MAGPLTGLRVIDLTAMVSGPLATAVLADQGADVIKIEPPGGGDLLRSIGASRGGVSAIFNTLNRGKRSLVLDLRAEGGRELLLELTRRADVFVQNFRPGVVERMSIGPETLRAANPELIYVSISGFGDAGPYAQRKVYDSVMQALSGLAASQTDPGTGEPQLIRNIVCDKVTALTVAQAITAALLARARGAGGQHIRVAMLDAAIAFLWPDALQNHTYLGEDVTRPLSPGAYPSLLRTGDGFMAISAIAEREFEGLCRAIERPELQRDRRFASLAERLRHGAALAEELEAHTRRWSAKELSARLQAEDVPHAPVNGLESLHEDPQVIANGLLVELEHPRAGRMRVPGPVARFETTPAAIRASAPELGEHTAELLAELGLPADRIEPLRARGVFG
ncbi:MAG: CaiB/BaiF CoA transferase family protein [Myxococcota bacterium]